MSFWPRYPLNIWAFPKRVQGKWVVRFFLDKLDIVGMVEVDGEDMVISFGGAWLELSTLEFDDFFSELQAMLLAY